MTYFIIYAVHPYSWTYMEKNNAPLYVRLIFFVGVWLLVTLISSLDYSTVITYFTLIPYIYALCTKSILFLYYLEHLQITGKVQQFPALHRWHWILRSQMGMGGIYNYKSGLKYEAVICILTCIIKCIKGLYECGLWSDMSIFWRHVKNWSQLNAHNLYHVSWIHCKPRRNIIHRFKD